MRDTPAAGPWIVPPPGSELAREAHRLAERLVTHARQLERAAMLLDAGRQAVARLDETEALIGGGQS